MRELRHAFAVERQVDGEAPMPVILERFAGAVCERGMGVPAVFLLETLRPLSFLASEIMIAASPFTRMFVDGGAVDELSSALSDRRNVERLIDRIEELTAKRGKRS